MTPGYKQCNMDPRSYIQSSTYCRAIQENLLEVGVRLEIVDVKDKVAFVDVQQIDHLEYLYPEAELLSRARAICREVPFETIITVLPARQVE